MQAGRPLRLSMLGLAWLLANSIALETMRHLSLSLSRARALDLYCLCSTITQGWDPSAYVASALRRLKCASDIGNAGLCPLLSNEKTILVLPPTPSNIFQDQIQWIPLENTAKHVRVVKLRWQEGVVTRYGM
jgi:hypothetical protein